MEPNCDTDMELVEAVDLGESGDGGAQLDSGGVSLDRMGVVRLGNPASVPGVLERRQRLEVLEGEVEAASQA